MNRAQYEEMNVVDRAVYNVGAKVVVAAVVVGVAVGIEKVANGVKTLKAKIEKRRKTAHAQQLETAEALKYYRAMKAEQAAQETLNKMQQEIENLH